MQIHSQTAELRALLTVTTKKLKEDKRTLWLGKLNKDHFYTPVLRQAFERIMVLARKRFQIVSWKSLIEDPSLDEDIRDILAEVDEKPCVKKSQMRETLETLEAFRKVRVMYDVAKQIHESLDGNSVDIDALVGQVAEKVTKASNAKHQDVFFLRFGKDSNSDEITEQICRNETSPRITTGMAEYDKINGGFPDSGVVILAATTSGGKSTIAMNVALHMYFNENYSVFRISLEMQEIQETQRMYSHMTGIPLSRFKHGKLTEEDKKKIRKAKAKLAKHGDKHEIHHTIHCPKGGLSMEEALQLAKPFGYKVIVVDYVGLLDEKSDKDQWKTLMDAARIAKNYTQETGTLVILLAQLDDESDKLRYSKGMKEHADTLIQWNYARLEQRELRLIPMFVAKDRDGESNWGFDMEERFDHMSVYNPGAQANKGATGGDLEFEDDGNKGEEFKKQKGTGKKGKGSKEKLEGKKPKRISKTTVDLELELNPGKKKKKKKVRTLAVGHDDGPAALS